MKLWSIIITVFTIAAFSFGPPLYWNAYLAWFFGFSQLLPPSSHLAGAPPESCCSIVSGLDDILSGRMWDAIFWVPPRGWLVVKYRSLGELLPYEINLDQWEMGDGREPKINYLSFLTFVSDTSLQTPQKKTFMTNEHAHLATCHLSSWPLKLFSASNSLHHIVSPLYRLPLSFFLTFIALGLHFSSKFLPP